MTRHDWKGTLSLAAALFLAGCTQSPQPAGEVASDEAILPANMNPDGLPAPTENMVFPWSVVPGGVRSPEGAQQAVDRDPLVKEHYRAVDIAKLRTEKLSKSKSAYVSYRMGDSIYWTRNPVLIKAGETVLTDGETMLRGRCGNMVSETAKLPVAPAHLEPAAAAMDVAVPASRLAAAIPPAISEERLEPSQAVLDRRPHASTSVLPSPEPQDALPGYAPHGAGGSGFVPITRTGGGAPASLGPPPESTSPPPIPVVITPMTPPTRPSAPPLYQPPPDWPTNWYPPPPDQPLPPPPVLYPPPEHPPLPPPPYHPPGQPPPYHPPGLPPPPGPPPHNPPPDGPPPGSPPPPGPPPSGPPPSGPPPSDPPPHFPPPPFDPPSDPPPPEPPPAVPEPTAFVLIGLGMIGLGIHLSRHKG